MSGPEANVIEGLFVSVGGRCNHGCTFCQLRERESQTPAVLLEQAFDQARECGHGRVVLTGGEPTLRGDLPELASSIQRRGLSFGLMTNGRMLLYPRLLASLWSRGLDAVLLWIHGPDAAVHDPIVRTPGAFEQTARSLRALAALPGLRLEIRTVLTKENLPILERMARWLSTLKNRAALYWVLVIPPPSPDGRDEAVLFLEPVFAIIRALREAGLRQGIPVFSEGLPGCLMGDLGEADIGQFVRERTFSNAGDDCLDTAADSSTRVLACAECIRNPTCPGMPASLIRAFPKVVPTPVRGVRSNAFDYGEVGRIEGFVPERPGCRGPSLNLRRDRCRHVLLWRDDGVIDFKTDTRDFSEDEIREIREIRQQILVDDGTGAGIDDFPLHVRQARLCEVCRDCPVRPECVSVFRIDPEISCRDEDVWLREELGRLRGRVLDVGCGDLRYPDLVRSSVEQGRITYEGLDPDPEGLARLRALGFDVKTHQTTIEAFDAEPGSFDHVLLLRSVNHFAHLGQALRTLAKLVRTGGTVIAADTLPFALLRPRSGGETVRPVPMPCFEHYRNFTSEQFLEFLAAEGLPFVVSFHHPVGPGTGNLWLVRLVRGGGTGQASFARHGLLDLFRRQPDNDPGGRKLNGDFCLSGSLEVKGCLPSTLSCSARDDRRRHLRIPEF